MSVTFLKKLGQIALAIGKVVPIAGPILSAIIPGTADDAIIARASQEVDRFTKIIVDVEMMGAALSLAGPDKLTAATPLIAQLILQSSTVAGRDISDPALFKSGCAQIASGFVAVLNSLQSDDIAVPPAMPATPATPAPPV